MASINYVALSFDADRVAGVGGGSATKAAAALQGARDRSQSASAKLAAVMLSGEPAHTKYDDAARERLEPLVTLAAATVGTDG